MSTPLLDRIRQRSIDQPNPNGVAGDPRTPRLMGVNETKGSVPIWLRRLTNKDMTAAIYSDGENR